MTTFNYKAIDKEGKNFEGTMNAKDKFELYHLIRKDGNTVVSAKEVKASSFSSLSSVFSFLGRVKTHQKIVFARNLGQMIDAGLPITRGLSIMERQAKKGTFKQVLKSLNESIGTGKTLSESMSSFPDVFSTLFISMVKAGEESGNLSLALKNVSNQMEKTYLLTKKVRGAMMYPAVILTLMVVIGILMMIFMVPTLTETFVGLGIKLPLPTRIIIFISNFLQSYILLVLLAIIVLVGAVIVGLKTKKGQRIVDYIILRFPIISEIDKQINSARTARTLSSLLSSGVDIVLAIGVTKDVVQNSYYKDVLEKVEKSIEKGEAMSGIFVEHENLYPLFVGEMVSVGEETGRMGEMLLGIAEFYEEEVDQKTKDMSSVVEPILMIVIGAAVGFFAISMLGPTYSLADAL